MGWGPQGEKEAAKPKLNEMQRKGERSHGWSCHSGQRQVCTPIPKADRGRLPRQQIPGGGALPEQETPVSKVPLLLNGSKASNSHMLSRTALPAPACQGCWWDPAADAASVDARHGPAAFPEPEAGSSQRFWSVGRVETSALEAQPLPSRVSRVPVVVLARAELGERQALPWQSRALPWGSQAAPRAVAPAACHCR